MKTKLFIFLSLALLLAFSATAKPRRQVVLPKRPGLYDSLFVTAMYRKVPPEKFVWNWRDAVLMKSFIDIARCDENRRPEVEEYVLSAMTRLAPKAHGRHPNGIAAGVGLAWLKEIGKNTPETDAALDRVLQHYREIPRAANGGCSHRPGRVELWDDTVYMLDIFLIGCYRATGNPAYLQDMAEQLIAHAEHLRDPKTGLWYHGWSESPDSYDDKCCQNGWNANPLHRNSEFWGRGNGWVAMAYADLLEAMRPDAPDYTRLKKEYQKMASSLRKMQDRRNGLWYQLPARSEEKGNYLETSCSAMFAYSLAKGARIGLLPRKYLKCADKAYSMLRGHFQRNTLDGVCEGSCIGDKNYYLSRKRVSGETYADGAFLMLDNELKINK